MKFLLSAVQKLSSGQTHRQTHRLDWNYYLPQMVTGDSYNKDHIQGINKKTRFECKISMDLGIHCVQKSLVHVDERGMWIPEQVKDCSFQIKVTKFIYLYDFLTTLNFWQEICSPYVKWLPRFRNLYSLHDLLPIAKNFLSGRHCMKCDEPTA